MRVEASVGATDEPFAKTSSGRHRSCHQLREASLAGSGQRRRPRAIRLPASRNAVPSCWRASIHSVCQRWGPETRPELAQQQGMGEKLILQAFGERLKLAVGLVAEKYRPVHGGYYGCKAIWRQDHMPTTSSAPCQPRAGGKSLGRKRIANADRVRPGLAVPQLCLGETGKRIEPACRRKAHQDRTKRESPVAHGVPSCDSGFKCPTGAEAALTLISMS